MNNQLFTLIKDIINNEINEKKKENKNIKPIKFSMTNCEIDDDIIHTIYVICTYLEDSYTNVFYGEINSSHVDYKIIINDNKINIVKTNKNEIFEKAIALTVF